MLEPAQADKMLQLAHNAREEASKALGQALPLIQDKLCIAILKYAKTMVDACETHLLPGVAARTLNATSHVLANSPAGGVLAVLDVAEKLVRDD